MQLFEADYEEELIGGCAAERSSSAFLLRSDDPSLEAIDVLTDPYVLLVPRDDPLAGRGPARAVCATSQRCR